MTTKQIFWFAVLLLEESKNPVAVWKTRSRGERDAAVRTSVRTAALSH